MMLAHWTDAIITMNKEDYKNAQKFNLRNGGKVYYIPGVGIDTSLYKESNKQESELRKSLGLSEHDTICISMGDLIPRKNYEVAIKAIASCKDKNIHYIICGQGKEYNKLIELASKLKIEQQIHFLGFRSDIKELLKISDVFLFTTLQEGMPRAMMEAMASGLPCIASDIRGNNDLLEEGVGGYLVPATDEKLISKKIKEMRDNPKLRANMGKENLVRIRKFDIKEVEKKIKNIYDEILA